MDDICCVYINLTIVSIFYSHVANHSEHNITTNLRKQSFCCYIEDDCYTVVCRQT